MDFPPNATINTSYSGTCNATASPRPHVYITVSSDGCLYTTNIVNTSKYTTEVKVTIPQVTAHCRNAIITCHACQITEEFTLNVTESKSITTNKDALLLSYLTDMMPTTQPTTTTTTFPPVPTNGPPNDSVSTVAGSAASSLRSTGLVNLIFIGVLLVYFIIG